MKRLGKIIGTLIGLVLLAVLALALYVYLTPLKPARPVGFSQVIARDPGNRRIPVAIWYPTTAKPRFTLIGMRGMRVATDGPVKGTGLPLVVISHGTGGTGVSHADTAIALAERGFVVAAPTHPGDNLKDNSEVGKPDWLLNRSRQLRRTIDMLLTDWSGSKQLDPNKIGMFGFSAGATSALINIGGKPDLGRISSHCARRPEFVCQLTSPATYRNTKPIAWERDPRLKAAVIAAPGLGFTFEPNGLSDVRAPVQLWSGSADETVPYASNAGLIRRLLPTDPDEHRVSGAGHLSFLLPCGLIGPSQICRDGDGFDRAAFHKSFNASVVAFFQSRLARAAPPSRQQPPS